MLVVLNLATLCKTPMIDKVITKLLLPKKENMKNEQKNHVLESDEKKFYYYL